MSSDATFSKQISEIVTKANNMCGWTLRTFRTREKVPMLQLWKSLVRSNIDYCCLLWNLARVGMIQAVEQIQRSYLWKIRGMQKRPRERYIIMYVWRILEGLTPNFNLPYAGGIRALYSERGRKCYIPAVS